MIINLKNVSFERQTSTILKEVDWQVKQGEHWCILGLNGSGKTSLLNIINGYQWPTTGEVSVLGHKFGSYDLRELRKEIGWVSSSLQTRMYESDTTINIILSGIHNTIGIYDEIKEQDEEKAEELLHTFRLSHVKNQPYRVLSQGERQKVLIARSLMNNPKLLILDEPCTGLDFIAREDLLDIITEMATTMSITLVYVTHHIDEIRPFISHTLLLKEGEVFAQGMTSLLINEQKLTEFFGRKVHVFKENDSFWLTQKK